MKTKLRQTLIGMLMVMTVFFSFPVMSHAADPATPATPANLSVSQTSNTVTLKWDAADKATGYRIFRKTPNGWVKYGTTKATSTTVKKLTAGTKYTFAVRSYNLCTCGKITWSDKYAACNTATKPQSIAKLTATSTDKGAALKWTASKSASGYEIACKIGNSWIRLGDTKATSGEVALTGTLKYTIGVRPYITTNDGKVYGDYTTTVAAAAIKAPKVEASSPEGGKLKLKWASVWGADGYRIYYKLGNGNYKIYKNVAKAGEIEIGNLKAGTYTVAVRAFDRTENGVVWSNVTPVKVTVAALDATPNCPHD